MDETRLLRMILVRPSRLGILLPLACRSCREVRDSILYLVTNYSRMDPNGPFSSVCLPKSRPSARSNHQSSWYAMQQGYREQASNSLGLQLFNG